MKKFLSFLVSRQFLAFLALLIVALIIWFIGPLVAFGGLRPLAGVGMRVLVIALLLAGVLLWLARGPISVVFAALVCLLIWCASPLLTFGRAEPFVTTSARIIAIAAVLAVFVIYWVFRLLQKIRANPKFLDSLLDFGGKKTPSLAAERLKEGDAHRSSRSGPAISGQTLSVRVTVVHHARFEGLRQDHCSASRRSDVSRGRPDAKRRERLRARHRER
jgi:type VI protein secretion system component VasK